MRINSRLITLLTGFFLLAFFSPALAARPLVTDDIYPVDLGGNEMEFGYFSIQGPSSGGPSNSIDLSLKRGLTAKYDLELDVPYSFSPVNGLNDLLLHSKYLLLQREDDGFAVRVDLKLANGDTCRTLGTGCYDGGVVFIYTKNISNLRVDCNLGWTRTSLDGKQAGQDFVTLSAALEKMIIDGRADIAAECVDYSYSNFNLLSVQVGSRYFLSERYKIDFGYTVGLNDRTSRNSLTAGIHCSF